MKKLIALVFVAFFAISLSGCGAKQKVYVCQKDVSLETVYGVDGNILTEIEITAKEDRILNVITIQTANVTDSDIYDDILQTFNTFKETFKGIDYYDVLLNATEDKIIYTAKINYEKVDIDAILAINNEVSLYLDENKNISLNKFRSALLLLGAECEEK